MAKVQNFMYAANVIQGISKTSNIQNQQAQSQTHVIAPLQIIVPLFIPSTYSFYIVFSIRDFDIKKEHNIEIQFCSPDDKILVETKATVPIVPDNSIADIPAQYKGFSSSIALQNTVLENAGVYKTNVIFDGENLSSYEIYVARKKS